MIFSSILFLCYFLPIFLGVYFLIDKKWKNACILLFSIVFYAWGAPKFIFVILGTTLLDFNLVHWMDRVQNPWKRKLMLSFSVLVNIGLLFYFKYSNFFIDNLNVVLQATGMNGIHWVKLALPVGISFYTFETITYVVDVYRRVHKPLKNFWDYQLYIILFPKLIAGPIIRYHELASQITERNENFDLRLTGWYRFVIGLSKKVLIANVMGQQADAIFATDYHTLSTGSAWIGALAYTLQIYFDFSGYSDMAIGLGKMMGFFFPENFNNPYTANSITDFWRRWHITLGSWMRNYLYIPLGGNQVAKWRIYVNLWLVFLASGLWHGASWSFIVWGAFHGALLVLERGFLLKIYEKTGKIPSVAITFLLVVLGWVFFRVEQLTDAWLYLQRLFAFQSGYSIATDKQFWGIFAIALVLAFWVLVPAGLSVQQILYAHEHKPKRHIYAALISFLLFTVCIASITASGFNPFIYFRF